MGIKCTRHNTFPDRDIEFFYQQYRVMTLINHTNEAVTHSELFTVDYFRINQTIHILRCFIDLLSDIEFIDKIR